MSIKIKLLIICILLVLLSTLGISVSFYFFIKHDKQENFKQRIQLAFDIIFDDLEKQSYAFSRQIGEYLQQNDSLVLSIQTYEKALSKVPLQRLIGNSLSAIEALTDSTRLVVYAGDGQLLGIYGASEGSQRKTSTWGADADAALLFPLTIELASEHMSAELYRAGKEVGLRVLVPLVQYEQIVGALVGDLSFTQEQVERYASLSKTEIDIFSGVEWRLGSLQEQGALPQELLSAAPACLEHSTSTEALETSPVTIGDIPYYQGTCVFGSEGAEQSGAMTISLSRKLEQQAIRRILNLVGAIVLVTIFLNVLLILLLVVPSFTKPIVALSQASQQIASGNLKQEITVGGSNELGVLAQNFAQMRDEVRKQMTELSSLNAELQTQVQDRNAEVERLRELLAQIGGASEQLQKTSDGMNRISSSMAAGAEETSQQTFSLSSASEQISRNVESVSRSTETTAATIQEISQNTQQVNQMISDSVTSAGFAKNTMAELEISSEEIGALSKVITDIAQQTNLLALNATIEAVRAGDFGRGFTVVAREVKELSRETSRLAEDIGKKIESVQQNSREATVSITQVVEMISKVSEFAAQIAIAITQQSAAMNEVSRAIVEVAQGSKNTTITIAEVSSAAHESAKQAVTVQDEAQQLSSLAIQLQQLVETFKR